MIPILAKHGGYRKTLTFAYACLVYHATETFCARNFSYRNDPLGKTVGQMLAASRSARTSLPDDNLPVQRGRHGNANTGNLDIRPSGSGEAGWKSGGGGCGFFFGKNA